MESNTISTVFLVIYCIMIFFITALNMTIILAVLKDPLKKLRSMFSYLLVHLCICNFLVGTVSIPVFLHQITTLSLSQIQISPASYGVFATHSIYTATVFNAFSLSIDRYKAIRDPICHRSNSNIKHVSFYVFGIWTGALVEFVGYFVLGDRFRIAFQILTFSVMSFAVVIMYFRIRNVPL